MIVRHYKGGLYRVLFNATESTNDRVSLDKPLGVVVYVSLTTGDIRVRDVEEFWGRVGSTMRFQEVRDGDNIFHPPITGRGFVKCCPCRDCREREQESKQ